MFIVWIIIFLNLFIVFVKYNVESMIRVSLESLSFCLIFIIFVILVMLVFLEIVIFNLVFLSLGINIFYI